MGAGASASASLWPQIMPQSSSHQQIQAPHTPLGELLASKADMMPAIFKTGFTITGILAVIKLLAGFVHLLVGAKHAKLAALHKGGSVVASLMGADEPVVAASSKETTKPSRKRRNVASPVFETNSIPGSGIDFEAILTQLDSIMSRFIQQHQQPSA